jgi:hypothetical protein
MHGVTGRLFEAQLLTGVGRVGNEFPDENLFVRIKRMDDDVQQLLNLGLKMVAFRLAHKVRQVSGG